ncbi:hypothetical protein L1987_24478 [Smallanthus sonchifolius]|uniref:Uncharacterized protein n=1 Tax=Smallanthus sonchifolius TaxID=185202 RepID=A0ACB9IN76_9ASTR|nr:hypothetical protein L1987_24478 [Smallanthus sonchifolius]
MSTKEEDAIMRGQAWFFHHLHSSLSSAALRCALELDIAGVMNRHDGPVTLSQIAQGISSPSLNTEDLSRLMRFLVHRKFFDEVNQLYSLNQCSKLLLKDTKNTLAPMGMCFTDPIMVSLLFNLNKSIKDGGTAAFKTHGLELWDFLCCNLQVGKSFNEAMACSTQIDMDTIVSSYDFGSLQGTLVDVGGGVGMAISEIVTRYPHLKGINFDLPHVVSSAPAYEGVTHVGGDMFTAIPPADSIFIKSMLHDWSDDKCVQILKNCRESITKRSGKLIIAEIVLNPQGDDVFDETRINMDLIMLACFDGGKERTEVEWKMILEEAGFCHYNIIKIPSVVSIIEAYTD